MVAGWAVLGVTVWGNGATCCECLKDLCLEKGPPAGRGPRSLEHTRSQNPSVTVGTPPLPPHKDCRVQGWCSWNTHKPVCVHSVDTHTWP